mgnify:CR=1 FL=1
MLGPGGAGRGDWRRERARPPQSAVTTDMEINPERIGMEREEEARRRYREPGPSSGDPDLERG